MDGLPAHLPPEGVEAFTSLTCPDCRGGVTVRLHKALAVFMCRVGHSYSVDELIEGKEAALETRLWEAVYAFEELAVVLDNLDRSHLADGLDPAARRERAAQAGEQAARLRSIIQVDRPIVSRDPPGHLARPAPPP